MRILNFISSVLINILLGYKKLWLVIAAYILHIIFSLPLWIVLIPVGYIVLCAVLTVTGASILSRWSSIPTTSDKKNVNPYSKRGNDK